VSVSAAAGTDLHGTGETLQALNIQYDLLLALTSRLGAVYSDQEPAVAPLIKDPCGCAVIKNVPSQMRLVAA
jgi:hypothetical protein